MRRRDFIGAIVASATASPLGARGQTISKNPTIGYMAAADASLDRDWVAAFLQQLAGLGWSEGSAIMMISRWAEGRRERYAEILEEFIRLNVDMNIFNSSGPCSEAGNLCHPDHLSSRWRSGRHWSGGESRAARG